LSSQIPRTPEDQIMDIPAEADAYAQADFSQVNAAFVDRLLELAGQCDRALCVDLGCGPADIPIRLARRKPSWQILAVDASEPMLAWARSAVADAGLEDRIRLIQADACDQQEPAACDVVCSNSILHHVEDPLAFWRQLARWGRPGALVLIRDLFRPESLEEARRIVQVQAGGESQLLQDEFYRSLLAAYTPEEIRGQLSQAGLENLQVRMVSDRHVDVWGRLGEPG
jgi:trans-aconitate methyltransferase